MKVAEKISKENVVYLYRTMQLIRLLEEQASRMYMVGKIKGFLHLYIGEEAIAVGSISTLRPDDYVVTHYRDHGQALAKGMDPKVVMAELFGRVTGSSQGKGGSMHLFDASVNFMGGYAIVGGQFPVAAGLALASQYKGEDRVTLCFFGDGALNEGEFHEAMNLASLWKLPMIFFLENNLYGMGSHIDETNAGGRNVYSMADAYRIPSIQVDGMDVLAVHDATREAVERVRSGGGPFFIEALAYRFRGHSMSDPADYRSKSEEEEWKTKDPIPNFRSWALDQGIITEGELDALDMEVDQEIEEATRFADESLEPPLEALYEHVYS